MVCLGCLMKNVIDYHRHSHMYVLFVYSLLLCIYCVYLYSLIRLEQDVTSYAVCVRMNINSIFTSSV